MTTMWFTFESGVVAPAEVAAATTATPRAQSAARPATQARVSWSIDVSPSLDIGRSLPNWRPATLRVDAHLPGDAVRVVPAARRERPRRGSRGRASRARARGDGGRSVD